MVFSFEMQAGSKLNFYSWYLILSALNVVAFVDNMDWPLHSLVFHYEGDGVTAEMMLRGILNVTNNSVISCETNFTWTPTENLNFTGEIIHVNATGTLSEGSHAVCLMNNISFLYLSVPCLFRDGIPKPVITGLREIQSDGSKCLSIEWEFIPYTFQVENWEIYCMDGLATTSILQNFTADAAYKASLCHHTASELMYCCVGAKLKLVDSILRTCDCQHIRLTQSHPKITVYGITAQLLDNIICIEFDWKFDGNGVINAGVCCSQSHLFRYESCNATAVPWHMKIFSKSWCGTYGPGNYFLYCYALNQFHRDEGVLTAKSEIYSSPIDGPHVLGVSYTFTSQDSQRCFILHWQITKSFYHLQNYSVSCGASGLENFTWIGNKTLKTYDSLRLSLMHCENDDVVDISTMCELKNSFYPNFMVSDEIHIQEPLKILVQGFLTVNRSDAWMLDPNDTEKSVCLNLHWTSIGHNDDPFLTECCASDLSSEAFCTDAGSLLCTPSHFLEPTANCYVKLNYEMPRKSNAVKLNLGIPILHKMLCRFEEPFRLCSYIFLASDLDRNNHSDAKYVQATPVFNNSVYLGFSVNQADILIPTATANPNFRLQHPMEQFNVTLRLQSDQTQDPYYAQYHFPENQSLTNISVEPIYLPNKICFNITWQNINKSPDYLNVQIKTVANSLVKCYGCSRIDMDILFNVTLDGNPYSSARPCMSYANACNCILECYVETLYLDETKWLVAKGVSGKRAMTPDCNIVGIKNVYLEAVNSSCVTLMWQRPAILHEQITNYKVTCSNTASEYNATDLMMLLCGLSSFTTVQCNVSALYAGGGSQEGVSNTIVTPCSRPGKVPKIYASPEIYVDRSGSLTDVNWNITWQPGLHNCESIAYNVTIEGIGIHSSTLIFRPWIMFKRPENIKRFTVEVLAMNNIGFGEDIIQESFIYEESIAPTPLVYLHPINTSCALLSIIYPLLGHLMARHTVVDCVLVDGMESVLNLTLKSQMETEMPVCLFNKSGTLRCTSAYRNFVGESSRAECNIHIESSTTVLDLSAKNDKTDTENVLSTKTYRDGVVSARNHTLTSTENTEVDQYDSREYSNGEHEDATLEFEMVEVDQYDSREYSTGEHEDATLESETVESLTKSAENAQSTEISTSIQLKTTGNTSIAVSQERIASHSASVKPTYSDEVSNSLHRSKATTAFLTERTEERAEKLLNTSPKMGLLKPLMLLSMTYRLL